ncbi:secondary thiamine-phosphate synthase enzyme [candidate division LCP-89 bacterium B3_LCP]|uniref:Secondary thiamine-phosphate synthase enzyme n=1 Tax=candidate division LCP-89 bacterium B3_LCP TaxID=2012998 RepID=A0A532V213_UNCL8|nr:MAG: secondary thiamine-phosphate synthase enzyme [candidate division LCP-89 bacterium B3_LCP]
MPIITDTIELNTGGHTEIHDITGQAQDVVNRNGMREGSLLLFVPGSTGGLTTVEYEPGLLKDLPEFFEKLAPSDRTYHHDATWGDGNGHSHVRASLLGPSLTVPFSGGRLTLGTWQQIIFIDFDNKSRNRSLVAQLNGE